MLLLQTLPFSWHSIECVNAIHNEWDVCEE